MDNLGVRDKVVYLSLMDGPKNKLATAPARWVGMIEKGKEGEMAQVFEAVFNVKKLGLAGKKFDRILITMEGDIARGYSPPIDPVEMHDLMNDVIIRQEVLIGE